MNQFLLLQGHAKELQEFPHIIEFATKKNNATQLNSLNVAATNTIRIYYIIDGKFNWVINHQHYILFPGDLVVIVPGHQFGGAKGVLDIGTLCWIHVQAKDLGTIKKTVPDKWSRISKVEKLAIAKILLLENVPVLSKVKEASRILLDLRQELFNQQIGYSTRVNQLIDELFILIARKLRHQKNLHRDFPQTFTRLEQTLRENLAHQWTVDEMAALVGLGTTAFTEKVKNYTGFSPLNYLITIRISESIKLLKRADLSVTAIALNTGFYSSQHFSTTFKKLTGYTPREFRNKNLPRK